jgi:hypothetical protein
MMFDQGNRPECSLNAIDTYSKLLNLQLAIAYHQPANKVWKLTFNSSHINTSVEIMVKDFASGIKNGLHHEQCSYTHEVSYNLQVPRIQKSTAYGRT